MECQFARTPRWCDLLEDSEVPGLRRGRGKGDEGNHGKFPFGENDELGNAHLHVARCDKTRPEDGHHVPSGNLVLSDELGAEPEALDEHAHHDELSQRRRNAPHCAKLPRSSF